MSEPVYDKFQIRIVLTDDFARAARKKPGAEILKPLNDVLSKHNATLSCQYDEFMNFVAEAKAAGQGDSTLARWTEAVLAKPAKVDYYKTIFVLAVKGEQLFEESTMIALKNDLEPLLAAGMLKKMTPVSNDPAKNPQAPRKFR